MEQSSFFHAALALALGLAAQVVATRLAIPGIILLLGAGVVFGPDVLGVLDPSAIGDGITPLVTFAVTVILFEGGLALRLEEIRAQQRSLVLLMTVGAAISMLGGTLAAHYFLALPWPIASLYGALMIVTGPTVVTPLLARIPLDRRVRELLIGEGVLIDPIGAIIAIVAAEYVVGHSEAWQVGGMVFLRLGIGGAIGAVAGIVAAAALRRGWIPDEMRNPVVFAVALIAAAAASRVSSEAGLMAAVIMGVVMGNTGLRSLGELRHFKEQMTLLLLSFIFVLLAADLRLAAIEEIGVASLAVVAVVIWIARPIAVGLSTIGSNLHWRERLFVAWVCPRGIVAVSVAGLFALELGNAGIAGGEALEALVFVTVAATVIVQGLTAGTVARALGIDHPVHQGTILVGASDFGLFLASMLQSLERQVALIDSNPACARRGREAGFAVFEGDARSVETLDGAGARYAYALLALTSNPELNIVVRDRARVNFRLERVLAVSGESDTAAGTLPFPGSFPGADDVNRQLRLHGGRVIAYRADRARAEDAGMPLGQLPWREGAFALLLLRRDSVYLASHDQSLQPDDILVCFTPSGSDSGLGDILATLDEAAASDAGRLLARLNPDRKLSSGGAA